MAEKPDGIFVLSYQMRKRKTKLVVYKGRGVPETKIKCDEL
jgi:hypothetical protein